ncbi:MAG TPA: hypothetical protein VHT73_16660 [Thermodesulfobacteriota bacterium]|nr:hypothetical protein [Thermodesulfobacteriota bacterium]
MGYLEQLEKLIAKQESKKKRQPEPEFTLENIASVRLSELARRDIALLIHSDVLGCEVWFCSNEKMVSQVKEDNPEAVTYTVSEIRELIKLNPTPEELKSIHSVKSVFSGSKVHCESCDCKTCTPKTKGDN